jgi:hypothetical protein
VLNWWDGLLIENSVQPLMQRYRREQLFRPSTVMNAGFRFRIPKIIAAVRAMKRS